MIDVAIDSPKSLCPTLARMNQDQNDDTLVISYPFFTMEMPPIYRL
jgi:hypothetical protein